MRNDPILYDSEQDDTSSLDINPYNFDNMFIVHPTKTVTNK